MMMLIFGFMDRIFFFFELPYLTTARIDTWNRDKMDISGPLPPKFVPGPLPAASLAPKENPEYSGLLECPMTTRLVKAVDGNYVVQTKGMCGEAIRSFHECFHAAAITMAGGGRSFVNKTMNTIDLPAGCTASTKLDAPLEVEVVFNSRTDGTAACAAGTAAIVGSADVVNSTVSVSVRSFEGTVTITLVGPSSVWFGVGFGASSMPEQPWTVIVDGRGAITERKLGNHNAGTILSPSVKLISSTVSGDRRKVIMSRPLTGRTKDYYSFEVNDSADATVKIIAAVGLGPSFAYHKSKDIGSLVFLPSSNHTDYPGACICPEAPKPFGQASGLMEYHAVQGQKVDVGTGSVGFRAGKCAPFPATVLIDQMNPVSNKMHPDHCSRSTSL